jgi:hypothetical protein
MIWLKWMVLRGFPPMRRKPVGLSHRMQPFSGTVAAAKSVNGLGCAMSYANQL